MVAIACAVVASNLVGGAALAPGAGAQAEQVHAQVRTAPAEPKAGDDVTATVLVTGCPPGAVTVEIYHAGDDGATGQATLMARAAAETSLVFRTRATITLPRAIEGWYGARVLCGEARPPKKPMANTLFGVGIPSIRRVSLASGTVRAGDGIGISGTGCAAPRVEYNFTAGNRYPGQFIADGSAPVAGDGTWSTRVTVAREVGAGPATIRVRCVSTNPAGDPLYSYYSDWLPIVVTAGS